MSWLQSLDTTLFRFINLKLSNPLFDAIFPQFADNRLFAPAVVLLAVLLLFKGGARGRLLVLMLTLILAFGDSVVVNTIKRAIDRPRPHTLVDEARRLVGEGSSGSMPSSHASIWCAAALMAFVCFPRSWRFMVPLALLVGFSRIYVGAHYPSDVLVGAILGAGYAAAGLWALNSLWQFIGRRWFPLWKERVPTLYFPSDARREPLSIQRVEPLAELQWLRLAYAFIAVLFITRLIYIGSGRIELSEDEAYQWLWSKHLAASYYSKPPMIAFAQWIGTSIWGDREIGVRFLAPVISMVVSVILLRFIAREVSAVAGFWVVAISSAAPLLAVGSTLMTVDPLLVLFWTSAMVVGWRAVQPAGTTRHWLATGLLMGFGFLSKYTAAIQIICFALFFLLWKPSRAHLRNIGPWLALGVFALCTLPVVLWNAQHNWVTVQHVGENAQLDKPWEPTLRYFFEFFAAEAGLLNPIFFIAALWAMFALWRRQREKPLLLYLFAMSAPVFFGYWLYSLHSRILPNWIAAAVAPMFCLAVAYWHERWRQGVRAVGSWLSVGMISGLVMVVICHNTGLIQNLTKRRLPSKIDPHRRVYGWKETAAVVGKAREQLLAEGKDVLILGSHYGLTGQITFYLPEARRGLPENPLVYYRTSNRPRNQFYYWPGYRGRHKGANAIYVDEARLPKLKDGWIRDWLAGSRHLYEPDFSLSSNVPTEVLEEFASVTDLGTRDIMVRGRGVLRRVRLYACRDLLR